MLTLLTATGSRPAAWALCERMMAAQDYAGPVRWVIVDDGKKPQPITFEREGWELEIVRPTPHWRPGDNTQSRNLREGLARVPREARLVIVEDDDFYSPTWLSTVDAWLQSADLVGESHARYYNVARRCWHVNQNTEHASLCATAMRAGALELFRILCAESHEYIDMQLWRRFFGAKMLIRSDLVLGIKGLPGRHGIGYGHVMEGQHDPDLAALRQLIGERADDYAPFFNEPKPSWKPAD